MRLVVARCSVDYVGRLTAHLPAAVRLLMVKADGSVSIHADDRAYKPLNWMSPPCRIEEAPGVWRVVNKAGEELRITLDEIFHDSSHDARRGSGTGEGRRGGPSAGAAAPPRRACWARASRSSGGSTPPQSGPWTCSAGMRRAPTVAVEVKRRGEIDGVEQLTRYLELLGRDPLLAPVSGILAAQEIKPQARVLARDRGIRCVVLDYNALRGIERDDLRLF